MIIPNKPVIERKFANAIIFNRGKILMVKKCHDNSYISGEWHFPGGKANEGESYKQCLIREVREETGLEVNILGLTYTFKEEETTPKNIINWIGETYVCFQKNNTHKVRLDTKELTDYKWVKPFEVPKLIGYRSSIITGVISYTDSFFSDYICPALKIYYKTFLQEKDKNV